MTYSFHPLASKELDEAVAHYLAVDTELANRFLDEVDSAIGRILEYPNAWQKLRENVRRCRLKHFEYGLVYKVLDSEAMILAVMHLRRDPKYWVSRV
jgi:plasmid stabilization system protein ParE